MDQGLNRDERQTPQADASSAPRVLVVDDCSDTVWMLVQLLQLVGFRVVSASNGQEALERLKQEPADVVLADIEMPVLDGLELARQVRADERLCDVPLVAYSGDALQSQQAEMHQAGYDFVLIKPVALPELESVLKAVVPALRPSLQV